MYSIDEDKEQVLPQNILYYFVYSKTLNVEKTSYLYAYIINNKDNIPETFKIYFPDIEKFAMEQLKVGRINTGLATIYKYLLFNDNINDEDKILLWNIAFRYSIECDNPNIKGIIVAHRELDKDIYTPISKGQVQIDVYNSFGEIFIIDFDDNLYHSEPKYTKNTLLSIDERSLDRLAISEESPISLIYTASKVLKDKSYNNKGVGLIRKVLDLNSISREFYQKSLMALISYYYNKSNASNYDLLVLDKYLMMLDNIPKDLEDKTKYIDLFIDRKLYDKAFTEIKRYGYEGVDEDRLLNLSSQLIKDILSKDLEVDWQEDNDILLGLAYYCLTKGKHNQYTVKYLIEYYKGSLEELHDISKVVDRYQLDSRKLDVNILTQVLFTQSREFDCYKVFKRFTINGINSILAKAFINYQSYEYLVRDYNIDERFFERMELLARTKKDDYCILALLKYYSKQDSLKEGQVKFVHRFLEEYIKRGIVLEFFKKFKNYVLIPYDFIHRTFVEYRGDPSSKVTISYRYFDGDEPLGEESSTGVEMERVFSGIFTRSFLLFYNQSLKYSITVEDSQGNVTKIGVKVIQGASDTNPYEENLYNQINLMKVAKDAKDQEGFIDCLDKIQRTDYIASKAFKPL